jgi:hypothetical protein
MVVTKKHLAFVAKKFSSVKSKKEFCSVFGSEVVHLCRGGKRIKHGGGGITTVYHRGVA